MVCAGYLGAGIIDDRLDNFGRESVSCILTQQQQGQTRDVSPIRKGLASAPTARRRRSSPGMLSDLVTGIRMELWLEGLDGISR